MNQSINKLIKACVRFAEPKYGELSDISHLNWLLIEARVNFTSMKFVSKALNKKTMLENLQFKTPKENEHHPKISYADA